MADTATSTAPVQTATPAAAPSTTAQAAPSPTPVNKPAPSRLSSDQKTAMLTAMDGGASASAAKTAAKAVPAGTEAKPGVAAAKGTDPAAASAKPAQQAAKTEGEEKPATHDDTPDKRAKLIEAKRVMLRQGFTDEDLASMPVPKMLERAEKFAKMQAESDKAFAALRSGKPQTKPNTSTPGDLTGEEGDTAARRSGGARKNDGDDRSGNPGGDATLDSILTDLVLDKDERSKLTTYDRALRATHAQAIKAVETQRDEALDTFNTMLDAVQEDRATSARDALSAEFPGLKDDAAFAKVFKRVAAMDPQHQAVLGPTATYRQLVRDACYIQFGPAMKEQARNELLANNAASRDGQPDGVGVRPSPGAASPSEYKDRLLALYDQYPGKGPDFERAKAALGKPPK